MLLWLHLCLVFLGGTPDRLLSNTLKSFDFHRRQDGLRSRVLNFKIIIQE